MLIDPAKMRQYLLGDLPEAEIAEISLRVISESEIEPEILLAESDLIEDYLEGRLSPAETDRFRSHFMVSAERRAHLAEITLLRHHARSRQEGKAAASGESIPPAFADSIRAYFRPLLIGAGAAAAIVAAIFAWQMYFQVSPLEAEYAELNTRHAGGPATAAQYSTLNLGAGILRDAASMPKKSLNDLTATSLFSLALPSGSAPDSKFTAQVVRSGTTVFTVRGVSSIVNANGREVALLLPRSIFSPGNFQIRLNDTAGKDVGTYNFMIE